MDDEDASETTRLRRAVAGDHQAFNGLVQAYQARLRGFVARYLFDQDDVHDVVQESFIEAWRSLPRFEIGRPWWPWLRAIAKNRVHMYFRQCRRRRAEHLVAVDDVVADLIEARAERQAEDEAERIAVLRHCLQDLQPHQRDLVHARFHDNQPVQDLARDLSTSPASITMRLQRLRHALRRCMERRFGAPA